MPTQEIRATITGHSADTIQQLATPRHILIAETGRGRPLAWLGELPLPPAVITGASDPELFLGIQAVVSGRARLVVGASLHLGLPLVPELRASLQLGGRCAILLGLRDLPLGRASLHLGGRCRVNVVAYLDMRGGR